MGFFFKYSIKFFLTSFPFGVVEWLTMFLPNGIKASFVELTLNPRSVILPSKSMSILCYKHVVLTILLTISGEVSIVV